MTLQKDDDTHFFESESSDAFNGPIDGPVSPTHQTLHHFFNKYIFVKLNSKQTHTHTLPNLVITCAYTVW